MVFFQVQYTPPLVSFRKEASSCRQNKDCDVITLSPNIGKKRSRFSAPNICLRGFKKSGL